MDLVLPLVNEQGHNRTIVGLKPAAVGGKVYALGGSQSNHCGIETRASSSERGEAGGVTIEPLWD